VKAAVFFDGCSKANPGPAGAGYHILLQGRPALTGGRQLGVRTNNAAEYEALLAGLSAARRLGARHVMVLGDSELVVRQLTGEYRVRNADLKPLYERAKTELAQFELWHATWVPRHENQEADKASNRALAGDFEVTL
jgi:ribonuclease HI